MIFRKTWLTLAVIQLKIQPNTAPLICFLPSPAFNYLDRTSEHIYPEHSQNVKITLLIINKKCPGPNLNRDNKKPNHWK